jgi:hypothetical protein
MKSTLLVLAIVLIGCTGTVETASESPSPPAATATESPPPAPSLSAEAVIAEVQANAASECHTGIPFDELWCEVVDFDAITFEGGTLTVPTMVDASATQDAQLVCSAFFRSGSTTSATHSDPIGIETIEILNADGDVAASCSE